MNKIGQYKINYNGEWVSLPLMFKGKSAYDIAKEGGYKGTEEEFALELNNIPPKLISGKTIKTFAGHSILGSGDLLYPMANEIWYTSSDGEIVEPASDGFDGDMISNTYENGRGIMIFDTPIMSIGDLAFYGRSSLTSITIPDSVTLIGQDAFYGCSSLTSVTIPNSVTVIGSGAFYNCTSLTKVTIGTGVTSIGGAAFENCTGQLIINNQELVETDYAEDDNPSSTWLQGSSFLEIIIGNNITKLGSRVFNGYSSLKQIHLSENVTSIGVDAFAYCTSLTSITIPDSVTEIGDKAFWNCTSLTSVTIGNGVTSIAYAAFDNCTTLTSITIPNSVTTIGSYAFSGCDSLTSVTIPDSVTEIGDNAFFGCTSLTNVTIGNGVTSIRYAAFYACESLTNITIPDSVTEIGDEAFGECTITLIFLGKTPPTIGSDLVLFGSISKIYVPRSVLREYTEVTNLCVFADVMVGSEILDMSQTSMIHKLLVLEEKITIVESTIEQITITE